MIRLSNCDVLPCHYLHEHSKQQFAFYFIKKQCITEFSMSVLPFQIGRDREENVFACSVCCFSSAFIAIDRNTDSEISVR